MSDDLVKWLRLVSANCEADQMPEHADNIAKAADEIERLHVRVAQLEESNQVYEEDAKHDNRVIMDLRSRLVKQRWQPMETAPKDGTTFWAMQWAGSTEESTHNALFWNAIRHGFECVESGILIGRATHWMPIPPFTDEIGKK